jgi:LPXTG-motif cell wall-anchored protein
MKRLVVSLMVATTLVAGAPAAHAAGELELSNDGATWSSNLAHPVFDPSVRVVPGDVETASFHVRNAAATGGALTVDVLERGSTDLIDTGDLDLSVRSSGGTWRPVGRHGLHQVVTDDRIAARGTAQIDVRVAFDPRSTNATQTKLLNLDFEIRLTRAAAAAEDTLGNGLLPDTGAPAAWPLMIGVALALAGIVITASGRREEEDNHV